MHPKRLRAHVGESVTSVSAVFPLLLYLSKSSVFLIYEEKIRYARLQLVEEE